ncbi:hypothetical protein EK904_009528 [Melospiza melodia maxima]|nr:hypothetical protein EK904_009528 [Melospiza melodia maxima]
MGQACSHASIALAFLVAFVSCGNNGCKYLYKQQNKACCSAYHTRQAETSAIQQQCSVKYSTLPFLPGESGTANFHNVLPLQKIPFRCQNTAFKHRVWFYFISKNILGLGADYLLEFCNRVLLISIFHLGDDLGSVLNRCSFGPPDQHSTQLKNVELGRPAAATVWERQILSHFLQQQPEESVSFEETELLGTF